MRKILITILAVTVFGVGAAFAQGMAAESYWVGLSAGYPGGQIHFGVSDVAPGVSVRANLGYGYFGYGFSVGVDGMYNLPVDTGDLPITVYAGLGPSASFGYSYGTYSNATSVGVKLFAGAEYRLGQVGFEPGGVFFEAGPMVTFVPEFRFDPVARLGFNYHF